MRLRLGGAAAIRPPLLAFRFFFLYYRRKILCATRPYQEGARAQQVIKPMTVSTASSPRERRIREIFP
jgi:hypothetical protein